MKPSPKEKRKILPEGPSLPLPACCSLPRSRQIGHPQDILFPVPSVVRGSFLFPSQASPRKREVDCPTAPITEWGLAVAVNSGRPLAVAVKAQRGVSGGGRPKSLHRAPRARQICASPECLCSAAGRADLSTTCGGAGLGSAPLSSRRCTCRRRARAGASRGRLRCSPEPLAFRGRSPRPGAALPLRS